MVPKKNLNSAISPSKTNEQQIHMTKRLEELNKWQESQKRLLQEHQNHQRELLGFEQESMYQMLGLRRESIESIGNNNGQCLEANGSFGKALDKTNKEEYTDTGECTDNVVEEENPYDVSVAKLGTQDAITLLASAYGSMANVSLKNEAQIKRPFLRKGEGIKQRFKIDPNELRLDKLPRYKFANTHSRCVLKPVLKKESNEGQSNKSNGPSVIPSRPQPLNLQEQQFQKMLLTSKNIYNSTPEMNNKFAAPVITKDLRLRCPSPTADQYTAHLKDNAQNSIETYDHTSHQEDNVLDNEYFMAWAQILNNRGQSMNQQAISAPSNSDKIYSRTEEESIFELLEQKANEDGIDMNSPSIQAFMKLRLHEKLNNSDIADNHELETELKNKPLLPQVQDVGTDTSSELLQDDTQSTDEEVGISNGVANGPSDTDATTTEVRVRFTDSNETHVFNEVESIEEITNHDSGEPNNSTEFVEQFKQALFAALKIHPNASLNDQSKLSETTLTPKESAIVNTAVENATKELQEKTDLIKVRLAELEKEIQNFKENNILLMKARQQHELEKTLHAQEHLEAMEQVKDEKIKLEIYLHDERMKLEDEKRKFEQQIRGKAHAALTKERKEMEKLRQQYAEVESQLKSKEQNHMAAQARVRSQMRNLEKEQKKLHEEIDRLTKENKRLENENLRISREQNNKLLQEINRNIAKLAPKPISDGNHAEDQQQRKNISETMAETSTARHTFRPLHKTYATSPKKQAKFARKGCSKLGNSRQPQRLVAGSEIETETTLESSTSDESKDVNLLNNQTEQQQQHHYQQQFPKNHCLRQQNKQLGKYYGDNTDDIEEEEDDILEDLDLVPKRQNNLNVITHSVSSAFKEGKVLSQTSLVQNESDNVTVKNSPQSVPTTNEMKREIVNEDGSHDIWYSNGNLKKISPDGMIIRMLYYNKDIKETNINEGTVKYYYAETNTWHTTYLDGLEILEFPNGQIEHRHKNGLIEIHYPNQSVQFINPHDSQKSEEWRFADGTQSIKMRNGDRILILANGQKEIHTKLNKRREYPDGTIKIVYPDGSQETRYSNGRIRLKNKDGKLMMDTGITTTLGK